MNKYEQKLQNLKADLKTAKLDTIQEIKDFCKKHYTDGLSTVVECYEDYQIQELIEVFGDIKKALLGLASNELERLAYAYGGDDVDDTAPTETDVQEIEDGKEDDFLDHADDEFEYDEKDYGPSNPWDAPGMSIRNFI